MKDRTDYEIYFSHQCDVRSFNRGGTKNIGFLAVKNKYPEDYQNITFVFNDIDTVPFSTIFDFETEFGIVKHFYGFKYALGGIIAIKGLDFENTNGYSNFWGWGMEDNVLQKRCEKIGLYIDRSQFFPIGSPEIIHLFDGVSRIINRKDPWRATHDDGIDGIKTIHKLNFTIDIESNNPYDNIHTVEKENIYIINITTFMTGTRFEHDNYHQYDLREPLRKIIHPDKIKTKKINYLTDDWSNIPFYPSAEKKNEMIQQYGQNTAEEIIKYSYENSTDPTQAVLPPHMNPYNNNFVNNGQNMEQMDQMEQMEPFVVFDDPKLNYYQELLAIKQYNEYLRQINSNQRIIPPNINKFSPAYSRIIAAKPKASASAKIRLGGVY
jgi:hypothetical protein